MPRPLLQLVSPARSTACKSSPFSASSHAAPFRGRRAVPSAADCTVVSSRFSASKVLSVTPASGCPVDWEKTYKNASSAVSFHAAPISVSWINAWAPYWRVRPAHSGRASPSTEINKAPAGRPFRAWRQSTTYSSSASTPAWGLKSCSSTFWPGMASNAMRLNPPPPSLASSSVCGSGFEGFSTGAVYCR